eukprot:13775507-Alexandrium_andersonii.AAC.2
MPKPVTDVALRCCKVAHRRTPRRSAGDAPIREPAGGRGGLAGSGHRSDRRWWSGRDSRGKSRGAGCRRNGSLRKWLPIAEVGGYATC